MLIIVIAIGAGLYMAWSIGANDVANAMGTSVGSRAITFRQAFLVAGVCDFLGAMLVGSHVTTTIGKGIIDPSFFQTDTEVMICGMLAALLGAALWITIASYWGLPVSTSHSIVGAVFAFGLVYGGISCVHWEKMLSIVASWVISPVAGAALGFGIFYYIQQRVFKSAWPVAAARRVVPRLVFLVVAIIFLSVIYKGPKTLHLNFPLGQAAILAAASGGIVGLLYWIVLQRKWQKCQDLPLHHQLTEVENIFRYLQIATACYVAFAHGANDVANAVGPLAGIYNMTKKGVQASMEVPLWILGVGAGGIVIGLATFGYRVIRTVGEKITELTPTRGFSAEFACATTVLVCSLLGLPVSTTHTIVGSVVGVGLARGISSVDKRVVFNVVYSWFITIPVAALITVILLPLLSRLF